MTRIAALLLLFALGDFAAAGDFGAVSAGCDCRRCCACCDDYCAKPMPCVPCAASGCCDDYCAKPMPCTAPLRYCGCDDYCPKPCCLYLPPCWPAWYTCAAPTSARAAAPTPR